MTLRALVLLLLVGVAVPAAAGGASPAARPETTITSGPAPVVTTSSATFTFTSEAGHGTVYWSVYRDRLTFRAIAGNREFPTSWIVKPYRRLAR